MIIKYTHIPFQLLKYMMCLYSTSWNLFSPSFVLVLLRCVVVVVILQENRVYVCEVFSCFLSANQKKDCICLLSFFFFHLSKTFNERTISKTIKCFGKKGIFPLFCIYIYYWIYKLHIFLFLYFL